jgi:hypothetical protein
VQDAFVRDLLVLEAVVEVCSPTGAAGKLPNACSISLAVLDSLSD